MCLAACSGHSVTLLLENVDVSFVERIRSWAPKKLARNGVACLWRSLGENAGRACSAAACWWAACAGGPRGLGDCVRHHATYRRAAVPAGCCWGAVRVAWSAAARWWAACAGGPRALGFCAGSAGKE